MLETNIQIKLSSISDVGALTSTLSGFQSSITSSFFYKSIDVTFSNLAGPSNSLLLGFINQNLVVFIGPYSSSSEDSWSRSSLIVYFFLLITFSFCFKERSEESTPNKIEDFPLPFSPTMRETPDSFNEDSIALIYSGLKLPLSIHL